MSEEYEEEGYGHAHLMGCTCDHDPDDHDWIECEMEDCSCRGHWEG